MNKQFVPVKGGKEFCAKNNYVDNKLKKQFETATILAPATTTTPAR